MRDEEAVVARCREQRSVPVIAGLGFVETRIAHPERTEHVRINKRVKRPAGSLLEVVHEKHEALTRVTPSNPGRPERRELRPDGRQFGNPVVWVKTWRTVIWPNTGSSRSSMTSSAT